MVSPSTSCHLGWALASLPTLTLRITHSADRQIKMQLHPPQVLPQRGPDLRTETTIKNASDFYVRNRFHNMARLRKISLQTNRQLVDAEGVTYDCILAGETFQQINHPCQVATLRTSASRFADPKVQPRWNALLRFSASPRGFSNRELREHLASLPGLRLGGHGRIARQTGLAKHPEDLIN
jgi:hypothetical protein